MIFFISLIHIYHASEGPAQQQHQLIRPTHLVMNIYQHSSSDCRHGTILGRPINMEKYILKKKLGENLFIFYQHSSEPGFSFQIYSILLTYNVKV